MAAVEYGKNDCLTMMLEHLEKMGHGRCEFALHTKKFYVGKYKSKKDVVRINKSCANPPKIEDTYEFWLDRSFPRIPVVSAQDDDIGSTLYSGKRYYGPVKNRKVKILVHTGEVVYHDFIDRVWKCRFSPPR